VEAEFDEGVLPAPGGGIPLGDLPSSPDYTLNASAEYRIPMSRGADLTLVGEYIRQGDVEYSATNNPIAHVAAVGVWNARVQYQSPNEKWGLTLWGRNLGDEDVVERVFELFSNPFIGKDFIVLAPPRTYGLSVRFNF
jgi:iron complex outermembrane receptor protein